MKFRARRGRPKLREVENDLGTKELQQKRKMGMTSEPIDVLQSNSLISDDAHRAAGYVRWLYSLSFGVPGAKTNYQQIFSRESSRQHMSNREEGWYTEQAARYNAVLGVLRQNSAKQLVFNLCIYQKWPYWLIDYCVLDKKTLSPQARKELQLLNQTLEEIGDMQS